MDLVRTVFMTLYTAVLVMVSIYGFHRWALVYLYYRHRRREALPPAQFTELPRVTVQLPMYNEQYVAKRIIEHACRISYPKDRLQIQVLDDSTDDTTQIASEAVAAAQHDGFDVQYIHRCDRTGYKAGRWRTASRPPRANSSRFSTPISFPTRKSSRVPSTISPIRRCAWCRRAGSI